MFLRIAIKTKLRKAGIDNPELMILSVDYIKDRGQIICIGTDKAGKEIKTSGDFQPSKESGENGDLYKSLLAKKKYAKLDAVLMTFNLVAGTLESTVYYQDNGNKFTEVLNSRI